MKVTTIRNLIFMTVILAFSVAFTSTQSSAAATGCPGGQTCCQKIQNACKCDGGTPVVGACSGALSLITCLNVPFAQDGNFKAACEACGGLFAVVAGETACLSFDP